MAIPVHCEIVAPLLKKWGGQVPPPPTILLSLWIAIDLCHQTYESLMGLIYIFFH